MFFPLALVNISGTERPWWRELPFFRTPRNDRQWSRDLEVLPEICVSSTGEVSLKHLRFFTYRTVTEYTPGYYDRAFHTSQIESVWFMVEPFSLLAAHTLVSFGLADGTYIAISVEIRKRIGQKFSQLLTLSFLRRHELVYVMGDERDLIKLRTNYRRDTVYLYPAVATREQAQRLFLHMLERAQMLQKQPEFYNPFTNTCLTNIVAHVNALSPKRIPLNYKILVARFSDEFAYRIGLLDQSLSFKELRRRYRINERALRFADDPAFSQKIRQKV